MNMRKIKGLDVQLFPLVGPLVMNFAVLKQNYGYAFRTSERFTWYVSVEGKVVRAFFPVEAKGDAGEIANYYVEGNSPELAAQLVSEIAADLKGKLAIMAREEHQKALKKAGFKIIKEWVRYARMEK
jgi:hypothetical protein